MRGADQRETLHPQCAWCGKYLLSTRLLRIHMGSCPRPAWFTQVVRKLARAKRFPAWCCILCDAVIADDGTWQGAVAIGAHIREVHHA